MVRWVVSVMMALGIEAKAGGLIPTYFATLVNPYVNGAVLDLSFQNPVFVVSNHPLHQSGMITDGELERAKDLSSKHERTALINMSDMSASHQGLKQLLVSKEENVWKLDIQKDKSLAGWTKPFMLVAAPYVRTDGGAQNLMMASERMSVVDQREDEVTFTLRRTRVKEILYTQDALHPFSTSDVTDVTFGADWKPFVKNKNPNGFLIMGDPDYPTVQNMEFISATMSGDTVTIKAKLLDPKNRDLTEMVKDAQFIRVFVDYLGGGSW